jgi:DNA-directed RNA polymerase subunit RPC12/RpoP
MQPLIRCPECGAATVGVTCLADTHWQYLCTECPAAITGEAIDPEYAAAERAKFKAHCAELEAGAAAERAELRRRDRGDD